MNETDGDKLKRLIEEYYKAADESFHDAFGANTPKTKAKLAQGKKVNDLQKETVEKANTAAQEAFEKAIREVLRRPAIARNDSVAGSTAKRNNPD